MRSVLEQGIQNTEASKKANHLQVAKSISVPYSINNTDSSNYVRVIATD